jgi:hypothetical protein
MIDQTHYSTGDPVRYRCPYCGTEVRLDPHRGCCGEVHWEVIPESELSDYDRQLPRTYYLAAGTVRDIGGVR